ncbi:MAG: hypothetical protein Q9220_003487 [cf. Caloplaca sp. 1 TL-2023]
MRLLPGSYLLSWFIVVLLAFTAQAAPSSPPSPPVTTTGLDTLKRGSQPLRLGSHTIANGWRLHWEVFNVIVPAVTSAVELRKFYEFLINEAAHRVFTGDPADKLIRSTFGKVSIEFIAERGYGAPIAWEIVEAFAEKMLEGIIPVTFICHVAPPGSDVGIQISLLTQ